jgi:hypothetical protein
VALTEVPVTEAVTDVGAPGIFGTVAAENDAAEELPLELDALI